VATKADFTDREWEVLQWAASDTVTYLTMADTGFLDMFREAKGAAKFMSAAKVSSESLLVRELAADMRLKRDKALTLDPTDLVGAAIGRVAEAAALVADKAPEDAAAFNEFILGIAQATAEAADGVVPTEAGAIEKLKAALG